MPQKDFFPSSTDSIALNKLVSSWTLILASMCTPVLLFAEPVSRHAGAMGLDHPCPRNVATATVNVWFGTRQWRRGSRWKTKTIRWKDGGRARQHCLSRLWGRVMSVWSHYPALSRRTNSQWPPSSSPPLHLSLHHPPHSPSLHPFLTTSTAHVLTTRLAHLLSNDCHSL